MGHFPSATLESCPLRPHKSGHSGTNIGRKTSKATGISVKCDDILHAAEIREHYSLLWHQQMEPSLDMYTSQPTP